MVRAKPNTGDPECPWQVCVAKTLLSSIRTKTKLETEYAVENIDSSETEDDDGLIDPMESPTFEASKIGKINNHEIIDVSKPKISTSAHTTGRKKRKSLPKISHILNFDDMPLGSFTKLGKKLIHGPNESTDSINHMVKYMRLCNIRMEDENRKRWQKREGTKREEKREERIMMARMEEERRSERNLARETNQSMMMIIIMALVSG